MAERRGVNNAHHRVMTPTQIVYAAHGSPVLEQCEEAAGRCYVCVGELSRGQSVAKWMGSNFTDQNRARNPLASHVCEACVYVHSRTAPVLGRPAKPGKKFGGNFRNYSHLYEGGWDSPAFGDDGARSRGYVNASKGEKPLIREFLRRDHGDVWFAAIADSGQKHVLPFTPMNGPGRGGRVLFDEAIVIVPPTLELVDAMMVLLTAGATKDEIERGEYRPMTWQRCPDAVRMFESENGSGRGGAWFGLALWLAQRDEEAVAARQAAEKEAAKAAKARKNDRRVGKGKAADRNSGDAARDAQRVPADRTGERAEALGDPPKPVKGRRKDVRDSRGVGNKAPARSADPRTGQVRLPGFD